MFVAVLWMTMHKILMLPTPTQALNDTSNSIHQIVLRLAKYLPAFGYELTENEQEADLVVGHAGQTYNTLQVDVAMCHGLYATAYASQTEQWHLSANQGVVNNLTTARAITVPSEWVGDILRRDMHVNPTVIPWAIEHSEWEPADSHGYVLWNKTRPDGVCNPKPVRDLAIKVGSQHFVSTFAENPPSNLQVIGRQPYEAMKDLVKHAAVYLATTKETFGIGTVEAMAAGVPVLGYRHGGTATIVQHGITGYIVEPGDIDGLAAGLEYCITHRATLGANARIAAKAYTWERTAKLLAGVFESLISTVWNPRVAVVIPHHNYSKYLPDALHSAINQSVNFPTQIVVVDDGSTPEHRAAARALCQSFPVTYIEQENAGVAAARNAGILAAEDADFIVCLDADDRIGNPLFLQKLADAMAADKGLGIAFTGLTMMAEDGTLGNKSNWPNGFDFEKQVAGQNCVPTCCMFRREAWRRAGGFRAQYTPAEDAELWLRITALGYRAQQVTHDGWFHYRLHGGSLSSTVREGQKKEPNWRDKPYIADKQYPFAAAGVSRPVRNYDRPKVSIIIPVADYHAVNLLAALDSVEQQTERYWECIVVNDTGAPLKGLTPYSWAKVIDTGKRNSGAGVARNLGVKASSAPFVTFLDADDVLLPKFLERCLQAFQMTGKYIYTDWISLNKQGEAEPRETPEYDVNAVFQKPIQHAINILLKRSWFDEVGGFDEQMISWEDVDFLMKLAVHGVCGARVPEPLFVYRYLTGQRREKGETIKPELMAFFNERYGEYIRGEKMCGCLNGKSQVQAQIIGQGAPTAPGATPQMVRIVYAGPPGAHTVSVGRQQYGYRKQGDTFYVLAEHVEQYPDKFIPIAEMDEKQVTPVPDPPKLLEPA
jgi:glycosyltransferase involved in cell wall biosynthesis